MSEWKPDWAQVYKGCVWIPDGDNDLIAVTRETLRLAKHLRRWPGTNCIPSKIKFDVTEKSAITVAAERYRFKAQGDLL